MKSQIILFSILLVAIIVSCSKKDDDSVDPTLSSSGGFYVEPITFDVEKNLVTDYGANNTDDQDDSQILQKAIDEITAFPNGGKLIIPAGDYYFLNIDIKSNVHIEIAEGATIYPTFKGDGHNHRIFNIGRNTAGWMKNVSVVGIGDGFTVEMRETTDENIAVFAVGNARNFKLSNFQIQDNQTIFASILVVFSSNSGNYRWAKNGIIEKARSYNAHLGYGLVQAYAADSILFRDIYSEGGVTLRLETDNLTMKEAGVGGLRDIYAKNVRSENGQSAVMFSPHFQENGVVKIDGVHAKNSSLAVRIEGGFVEIYAEPGESREDLISRVQNLIGIGSIQVTYLRSNGTVWVCRIRNEFSQIAFDKTGIAPGVFEGASVTNVTAEYGEKAHYKVRFIDYVPCAERQKICQRGQGMNWYEGPSVAAVFDDNTAGADLGSYIVEVTNVTDLGFPDDSYIFINKNTSLLNCASMSYPLCQ